MRALLALAMLVAPVAEAETIHWATTPEFPTVLAWELCDEGGVCSLLTLANARGGPLPDGRPANHYWADTTLFPGQLAWVRAIVVGGYIDPQNATSRVWCSHWDFNGDNIIGAGDLASWLRLGAPGGAPEFANGLTYFWERCK